MRFSKGTSFNSHDTHVEKGVNGRIQIDQTRGVKARCELSLNRLLAGDYKGLTASMVAKQLNSRLSANYSTTDISYALERLVTEGVIKAVRQGKREDTIYRAGKSSLDAWRRLPKE